MVKATITVSEQGGKTVAVEIENGCTIKELLDQIGESKLGKQLAVNGRKADKDTCLQEGDNVSVAKSAKGG